MPDHLDLPEELSRLIEKRERDNDRRTGEAGPPPEEERRSGMQRRKDPPSEPVTDIGE